MKLILPLLMLLPCLGAQAIDVERSRFLSGLHGRPGACAPFRLVFTAASETERVTVRLGNVSMTRDVNTKPGERAEVILPVYVSPDVQIEVAGDVLSPRLPLRRIEPDYSQPYVAVFGADAMYLPTLIPSEPGRIACDYFENREFFTDWRLLDGYDGLILFRPEAQRPPPGTQRAIAEFCSMGGAAVIVGSFRMGERVEGLPAPGAIEVINVEGVSAQRMSYGAGAVYRIDFEELRRHGDAQTVLRRALTDHMWFGADNPPGGAPTARAPVLPPAFLAPGEPPPPAAGAWLIGLSGLLLLLCGVVPLVARRLAWGRWAWAPAVIAGSVVIGGLGLQQQQAPPVVDEWVLLSGSATGGDEAVSARVYRLPGTGAPREVQVSMADELRCLPRPFRSALGHEGWQLDVPLVRASAAEGIEFAGGRVGDIIFRDYAAVAYRGETAFSTEQARLLEWWLEANAYRGRAALLAPAEWQSAVPNAPGVQTRSRAALWAGSRR